MGLATYSVESATASFLKYKADYNAYSDVSWTFMEKMIGRRLGEFKNEECFQQWYHSKSSRMLILVGYNNASAYSTGNCWVSTVAIDMIDRMRNSDHNDPCAFYILGARDQEEDLFPQVLSSIVYQLLISNRQGLQNETHYSELCARIEKYREAVEIDQREASDQVYGERSTASLREVALGTLNILDRTKTVWIILDHVERCKSGTVNHRKELMKALVYLMEKAAVRVRVLAVVNGNDWRIDKQVDELGQNIEGSICCRKVEQQIVSS